MKLRLLLCAFLFNGFLFAQTTSIPDPNFEQHFINMGADGVLDGQILTAIAQSFNTLNVTGLNISDLTGIEDFVNLQELQCSNNNLTSLNISTLTALEILNVSGNNISTIDVSNNLVLEFLDCSDNNLSVLDTSFNSGLDNLNFANNIITAIDLSSNTVIQTLNCTSNGLNVLDLTNNTSLKTIQCEYNNLTSLDVTNMSGLRNIFCGNNNISVLDVSSNPDLIRLSCEFNQIDFLDVSSASGLIFVNVRNNNLEGLNVKNGNNTNVTFYDSRFNSFLNCVEVDDVAYSVANWTNVTNSVVFNSNCHFNETYVPDDNFESTLISLGYDSVLDDYVDNSNINTVATLNVALKDISDLTGIEGFTALQDLNCARNNLTSLDVSENTNLISLNCNRNNLTSLSITDGTGIQQLNLTDLQCGENALTGLSTNFYPNLVNLSCPNNSISNLNSLFTNVNLESLICNNNTITNLSLANNTALSELDVRDNQLTSLYVKNGNNANIVSFNTLNNLSLNCIDVDDVAYSIANWTNIDVQTSFSTDCSLSINEFQLSDELKLYPNPATNYFTLKTNQVLTEIAIHDIQGKWVKLFQIKNEQYNIEELTSGLYFVNIKTENGNVTKKLIKN